MGNASSSGGGKSSRSRSRSRSAPAPREPPQASTALPDAPHATDLPTVPTAAAPSTSEPPSTHLAHDAQPDRARSPSPSPDAAPASAEADEKPKKKGSLMGRIKRISQSRERSGATHPTKAHHAGKSKANSKHETKRPEAPLTGPSPLEALPLTTPLTKTVHPSTTSVGTASTAALRYHRADGECDSPRSAECMFPPHHEAEDAAGSEGEPDKDGRPDEHARTQSRRSTSQKLVLGGDSVGHGQLLTVPSGSVLSHTPILVSDDDEELGEPAAAGGVGGGAGGSATGGGGGGTAHGPRSNARHSRRHSQHTVALTGAAVDSTLNISAVDGTLEGSFHHPSLTAVSSAAHLDSVATSAPLLTPIGPPPPPTIRSPKKAPTSPWWRRSPIRRRAKSLEGDDDSGQLPPPPLSLSPPAPPRLSLTSGPAAREAEDHDDAPEQALTSPPSSTPVHDEEADAEEVEDEMSIPVDVPEDAPDVPAPAKDTTSDPEHRISPTEPQQPAAPARVGSLPHSQRGTSSSSSSSSSGSFVGSSQGSSHLHQHLQPQPRYPMPRPHRSSRAIGAQPGPHTGPALAVPSSAGSADTTHPMYMALPLSPPLESSPRGWLSGSPRAGGGVGGGLTTPRSALSTPGVPPVSARRSLDGEAPSHSTLAAHYTGLQSHSMSLVGMAGMGSVNLADEEEEDPPTTHYDAQRHYPKPPAQSDAEVEALYAAVPEETSIDEDWDDEEEEDDEDGQGDVDDDDDAVNNVEEVADDEDVVDEVREVADGALSSSTHSHSHSHSRASSSHHGGQRGKAGQRRPYDPPTAPLSGRDSRRERATGPLTAAPAPSSSPPTSATRRNSAALRRSIQRQLLRSATDGRLTPRGTASLAVGTGGVPRSASPRRRPRGPDDDGSGSGEPHPREEEEEEAARVSPGARPRTSHSVDLSTAHASPSDSLSTAPTVRHHSMDVDGEAPDLAVPFALSKTPSPRSPLGGRTPLARVAVPPVPPEVSAEPALRAAQPLAYPMHGHRRHSPRQSSAPSWVMEDEEEVTPSPSTATGGTGLPHDAAHQDNNDNNNEDDNDNKKEKEGAVPARSPDADSTHSLSVKRAARPALRITPPEIQGRASVTPPSLAECHRRDPSSGSATSSTDGQFLVALAKRLRRSQHDMHEANSDTLSQLNARQVVSVHDSVDGDLDDGEPEPEHVLVNDKDSDYPTPTTALIDGTEESFLRPPSPTYEATRAVTTLAAAPPTATTVAPITMTTTTTTTTAAREGGTRARAASMPCTPPTGRPSTIISVSGSGPRAEALTRLQSLGPGGSEDGSGLVLDTTDSSFALASGSNANWVELPTQSSFASSSAAIVRADSNRSVGQHSTGAHPRTRSDGAQPPTPTATTASPLHHAALPKKRAMAPKDGPDGASEKTTPQPDATNAHPGDAPTSPAAAATATHAAAARNLPPRRARKPSLPSSSQPSQLSQSSQDVPAREAAAPVVLPTDATVQVSTPPTPQLDVPLAAGAEPHSPLEVVDETALASMFAPPRRERSSGESGEGDVAGACSARSRLDETMGSAEADEERPWWNRSRRGPFSSLSRSLPSHPSNIFADTDRSGGAMAAAIAALAAEERGASEDEDAGKMAARSLDEDPRRPLSASSTGLEGTPPLLEHRNTERYTSPVHLTNPTPEDLVMTPLALQTTEACPPSEAAPDTGHALPTSEMAGSPNLSAMPSTGSSTHRVHPSHQHRPLHHVNSNATESGAEELAATVMYSASRPVAVPLPPAMPRLPRLSQDALRAAGHAGGVVPAMPPLAAFTTTETASSSSSSRTESEVRDDTVGSITRLAVLHPSQAFASRSSASTTSTHMDDGPLSLVPVPPRPTPPPSSSSTQDRPGTAGYVFVDALRTPVLLTVPADYPHPTLHAVPTETPSLPLQSTTTGSGGSVASFITAAAAAAAAAHPRSESGESSLWFSLHLPPLSAESPHAATPEQKNAQLKRTLSSLLERPGEAPLDATTGSTATHTGTTTSSTTASSNACTPDGAAAAAGPRARRRGQLPVAPEPAADDVAFLTSTETWHRRLLEEGALALLAAQRAMLMEALTLSAALAPAPASAPAATVAPSPSSATDVAHDADAPIRQAGMNTAAPKTPRDESQSNTANNDNTEEEEEAAESEDGGMPRQLAESLRRSPDAPVAKMTLTELQSLTGASASTMTFGELSPSSRRPSLSPGYARPLGFAVTASAELAPSTGTRDQTPLLSTTALSAPSMDDDSHHDAPPPIQEGRAHGTATVTTRPTIASVDDGSQGAPGVSAAKASSASVSGSPSPQRPASSTGEDASSTSLASGPTIAEPQRTNTSSTGTSFAHLPAVRSAGEGPAMARAAHAAATAAAAMSESTPWASASRSTGHAGDATPQRLTPESSAHSPALASLMPLAVPASAPVTVDTPPTTIEPAPSTPVPSAETVLAKVLAVPATATVMAATPAATAAVPAEGVRPAPLSRETTASPASPSTTLTSQHNGSGAFSAHGLTGSLLQDLLPEASIVTVSTMTESRPRRTLALSLPSSLPPSRTHRRQLDDPTSPSDTPGSPSSPMCVPPLTEHTLKGNALDEAAHPSSRAVCLFCDQLYTSRAVCPVAQLSHAALLARRKHEKAIKKKAQSLLSEGKIAEAVRLLAQEGVVATSAPSPARTAAIFAASSSAERSPSPRAVHRTAASLPPPPPSPRPASTTVMHTDTTRPLHRRLRVEEGEGEGEVSRGVSSRKTARVSTSLPAPHHSNETTARIDGVDVSGKSYWNAPPALPRRPRSAAASAEPLPDAARRGEERRDWRPIPQRRGPSYGILSPARDD